MTNLDLPDFLEKLDILQVHCLRGIRYFHVFHKRRPRRSLAVALLFPGYVTIWTPIICIFLGFQTLDSFRYLHNISIISQLISCLVHYIHECLECAGIDLLEKYFRLETTNEHLYDLFLEKRWEFPAANTQNLN